MPDRRTSIHDIPILFGITILEGKLPSTGVWNFPGDLVQDKVSFLIGFLISCEWVTYRDILMARKEYAGPTNKILDKFLEYALHVFVT